FKDVALLSLASLDFVSQDEMLTPLGRLDKYAASENVFNRADRASRADGAGAAHCPVLSRKPARHPVCLFQIPTAHCGAVSGRSEQSGKRLFPFVAAASAVWRVWMAWPP
uniref:Uncharacterized protein n=1 Tax=Sus scrofa TaxID=9823 RepID=A0A8D0MLU2_PIG